MGGGGKSGKERNEKGAKQEATTWDGANLEQDWEPVLTGKPTLKGLYRRLQKCKMKVNLRNRQDTSFRFDQTSYRKVL